jgi:putative hydrolase of the HAD superfamily
MIKAVFFDWFNTLACYDPPREEMHSQILREFGIEVPPPSLIPGILAADKYFFAEISRLPVTKRSPEEQEEIYIHYADIMLNEAGFKADRETMSQISKRWPQVFGQTRFVLFDDVITTVKILKDRQLKLGVITNALKDVLAILRQLGLEPYLDFAVTSEEAKTDKPDPAIFLLALEKAGVMPSEAIHVGDQYDVDVVGARGAGITPVLIDRYDLFPEVQDCPRVRTLSELFEHL